MRRNDSANTTAERMQILLMALPSMAAMAASGLCVLTDALLLARSSVAAAAAAALGFPVLSLIQTIGFTFGMGAGSFVSRSIGANQKEEALAVSSTAFFSALALSFALCAAGFAFSSPLARLLGADDVLAPQAAAYMRWLFLCGPLQCMNLVLGSLLRARGDTFRSMIAVLCGAAAGILLQYPLIVRLSLGVSGSGAAMLARELASVLPHLWFLFRRNQEIRPRPGMIRLSLPVFAGIMRSGLPTLLRQGAASLSSALLSRACAAFGPAFAAGMGLCVRFSSLVSSCIIGFGQGFQPVCGMACGAGDWPRIRRAYRFCMSAVVGTLLVLGAAVFRFAPALPAVFSRDGQAAAFAEKALRVQSLVFFAQGAIIMMNMLTQSMGLTLRASLIATSRQGYVLIPLLFILPRLSGEAGLLAAQGVSDLLSLILCFFLTRGCLPRDPLTRFSCAPCGYSDVRTALR